MSYSRFIGQQLFSTKSFVPGHLVGVSILLFGIIGLVKMLSDRAEAQAQDRLATTPKSPSLSNQRGEYGKRP